MGRVIFATHLSHKENMRRKRVKFKSSVTKKRRKMGVTKGDITEICCFSKPPIAVAQVACAFATLLNNKSVTDWGSAKSYLTVENVKQFESTESFDDAAVRRAKKFLDGLNKCSVKKVSAASASLYILTAKKLGLDTSEPEQEKCEEKHVPVAVAPVKSPLKSVISKGVIVELKALANPPEDVKNAVCAWSFLLTDKGCKNWYQAKCFLGDWTLLKRVTEFDPSLVNPNAIKNSKKFFSKVDRETMAQKSACIKEISQWCDEVYNYEPKDQVQKNPQLRNPFNLTVVPIPQAA